MGQATDKQIRFAKAIAQELGLSMPENQTFESMRDFIASNSRSYYDSKNQMIRNEIIDNIDILDYAQELGFTLIRKGKYYSLKEHDSVIIDTQKKCFWRNSEPGLGHSIGKGDSVIGFAEMFSGKSKQEIMKDFSERIQNGIKPAEQDQQRASSGTRAKVPFTLPEAGENMHRVYAYLTKSRMISPKVVQDLVDKKMLYQSRERGNCVFVSYDDSGKAVAACMRGTNTERRFVGDVENCDYSKGFYINNHSDNLIVTESYIDAMSVMTILDAQGIDYHSYDYMPLSGAAKFESLINYLKVNHRDHVLLALDNDEGGRKNSDYIKAEIQALDPAICVTDHCPSCKDWNDELKTAFSRMKVSKVEFLGCKESGVPVPEKKTALQRALEQRASMMPRNHTKTKGIDL